MANAKELVLGYLKEKGLSEEELQTFGDLYDKEVTTSIQREAAESNEATKKDKQEQRTDIAKLANESRITE